MFLRPAARSDQIVVVTSLSGEKPRTETILADDNDNVTFKEKLTNHCAPVMVVAKLEVVARVVIEKVCTSELEANQLPRDRILEGHACRAR